MKKTTLLVLVLAMLLSFAACSEEPAVYDLGGGTLDQNYMNNSDFEDVIASIPTKEGYVFAGWYSDAAFTDYIDPAHITSAQEDANRAFAKWIVVKDSATYNVRETEATITDSGRANQKLDQVGLSRDYNLLDLKRAGYQSLSVKVSLDISEIDDGYQYIFLYKDEECTKKSFSFNGVWDKYVNGKSDETDPSCLYAYQHEHTPGENDHSWQPLTFEAVIRLADLENDLYLRYGASGNDDDDWQNRNVVVTVKPLR